MVAATSGGRLNVLLTDGVTITATAYGDTLCWRAGRRWARRRVGAFRRRARLDRRTRPDRW
ncbi:MAG: hypothetical protein WKF47_03200 [Geodermatophilaceae bacterium]